MKFRVGAIVKSSLRSVVDVPAWIGFNWLKGNTLGLIQFARSTIKEQFPKAERDESFEQAIERMNLTEEDLKVRLQSLTRDSYIYVAFIAMSIAYMFYLFWNTHFFAGILTYLVSMAFMAKWAKARFWIFQIKQRKLGCTVSEWLSGKLEDKQND